MFPSDLWYNKIGHSRYIMSIEDHSRVDFLNRKDGRKGCVHMLDGGINVLNLLRIGADIALVWYVSYKLIMLIRGTKAIQLLKGIVVVLVVWLLSSVFELQTIQYFTNQAIRWGFLVIVILFPPELRRALEQLGRGNIFARGTRSEEEILEQ